MQGSTPTPQNVLSSFEEIGASQRVSYVLWWLCIYFVDEPGIMEFEFKSLTLKS